MVLFEPVPGHCILVTLEDLGSPMVHVKFQDHGTSCSEEEYFKGFGHVWAWWPSCSCDHFLLFLTHHSKKGST